MADKIVIITGASAGIGEATAKLLASKGATIALAARRGEKLRQVAAEIQASGGKASVHQVDVTEKGLQSLAGLTNLVDLDLSFARFAEPGLQVLVTLPQLKRLGLEQTTVTDKAMVWIARLPGLEALNLNYTTVSDDGFASCHRRWRRGC